MDAKIKNEWIRRLRSGDYTQGVGVLCGIYEDEREYCCLGVLCELAAERGVVTPQTFYTKVEYQGPKDGYPEASVLPLSVAEWSGLYDNNPMMTIESGAIMTLSVINDGTLCRTHSFDEIADLIERQL